jgi:hypothetical protein
MTISLKLGFSRSHQHFCLIVLISFLRLNFTNYLMKYIHVVINIINFAELMEPFYNLVAAEDEVKSEAKGEGAAKVQVALTGKGLPSLTLADQRGRDWVVLALSQEGESLILRNPTGKDRVTYGETNKGKVGVWLMRLESPSPF